MQASKQRTSSFSLKRCPGFALLTALLLLAMTANVSGASEQPAVQRHYDEPLRPQFHFTSAKNWLNDPNGCLFEDGVYHLFFQYDPDTREGVHKAWGHATSVDFVHWSEKAVAIAPDAMGDIWSGSGVVDSTNTSGFSKVGEAPPIVLIYTAAGGVSNESRGKPFVQCLAFSPDHGKTFTKYANNPVLENVRGQNRDPKVVWHAASQKWILSLYLDRSTFNLFSSTDLKTWTKIQELDVPGLEECPDFYEMPIEGEPGKTAWIFTAANAKYLVGSFDGKAFAPEGNSFRAIQSEFNRTFYAGQTFSNLADSRRVQIAWMRDGQYPGMPFNQQMTFPTELRLRRTNEGLRLFRLPVREIESLRDKSMKRENIVLNRKGESVSELRGDCFDLSATIDIGTAKTIQLDVSGQTIQFDAAAKTLSCLKASAPLSPVDGKITLRVLVDRTSIEIFANDGIVSLSGCFLPKPGHGATSPVFSAEGGVAKLVSFSGSTLKSAWQSKDSL